MARRRGKRRRSRKAPEAARPAGEAPAPPKPTRRRPARETSYVPRSERPQTVAGTWLGALQHRSTSLVPLLALGVAWGAARQWAELGADGGGTLVDGASLVMVAAWAAHRSACTLERRDREPLLALALAAPMLGLLGAALLAPMAVLAAPVMTLQLVGLSAFFGVGPEPLRLLGVASWYLPASVLGVLVVPPLWVYLSEDAGPIEALLRVLRTYRSHPGTWLAAFVLVLPLGLLVEGFFAYWLLVAAAALLGANPGVVAAQFAVQFCLLLLPPLLAIETYSLATRARAPSG